MWGGLEDQDKQQPVSVQNSWFMTILEPLKVEQRRPVEIFSRDVLEVEPQKSVLGSWLFATAPNQNIARLATSDTVQSTLEFFNGEKISVIPQRSEDPVSELAHRTNVSNSPYAELLKVPVPRLTRVLSDASDMPDGGELRRLLGDYLFGELSNLTAYALGPTEFEALKFILIKKFFKSQSRITNKIKTGTIEDVFQILVNNRPHIKKQIFKRVFFIQVWKFMHRRELPTTMANFEARFNYKSTLKKESGNLTTEFYEKCFSDKEFKRIFLDTCRSKEFIEHCNLKQIASFQKNFEEWFELVVAFQRNKKGSMSEKNILMKMKFQVFGDTENIEKLFGLS